MEVDEEESEYQAPPLTEPEIAAADSDPDGGDLLFWTAKALAPRPMRAPKSWTFGGRKSTRKQWTLKPRAPLPPAFAAVPPAPAPAPAAPTPWRQLFDRAASMANPLAEDAPFSAMDHIVYQLFIPEGLVQWRRETALMEGRRMSREEGDRLREVNTSIRQLQDRHPFPEVDECIFLDTTEGRHDYWVWDEAEQIYLCSPTLNQSASALVDKSDFERDKALAGCIGARINQVVAGLPRDGAPPIWSQVKRELEGLVEETRRARQATVIPELPDGRWNYEEDMRRHRINRLPPAGVWGEGMGWRDYSWRERGTVALDTVNLFDPEYIAAGWDRANQRGTAGHLEIERYFNGMDCSAEFLASPQGGRFMQFMRDYPQYSRESAFRMELSVQDRDLGIPGQIDAVFRVLDAEGRPVLDAQGRQLCDILDWKFVENMTKEKQRKYQEQLRLYAYLFTRCLHRFAVRKLRFINLCPLPDPLGALTVYDVPFDDASVQGTLKRQVEWLDRKRAKEGRGGGGGQVIISLERSLG